MQNFPRNKYHLSLENEYNYWINFVIDKWIKQNNYCPNCKINSLKYTKTKSLFNPVIIKCSKRKCRKKINLRKDSFFTNFPKTPISIIIKIIEYFIIDNKNCVQIINGLKDYYQIDSIHLNFVYSAVNLIRKYISHYLKEIYINPMNDKYKNSFIAIDESLFCYNRRANEKIWFIG